MMAPRARRDPQRGNSLVLALIVLSSLATLGSLTVVNVQSSLKASTNDRSHSVALYAAESGAAAGIAHLRENQGAPWETYLPFNVGNAAPLAYLPFPANGAKPGSSENLFTTSGSTAYNAWFEVQVMNNRNDPGFQQTSNIDTDKQVILRCTGHGPQGSVAIIEVEVRWDDDKENMILLGWHPVQL